MRLLSLLSALRSVSAGSFALLVVLAWPAVAAAGTLTLKAFPDTPIQGDVDRNDEEAPYIRFSAFDRNAYIPREWIESLTDDNEDLEIPDVADDNDAAAWCDQGEVCLRRGDSRKAKRAYKKAFEAAPGLDRARAGWLRFEIDDLVKDLLRHPEDVAELFDPFSGPQTGAVVCEYCAWLHACTAMELRAARDKVAKMLQMQLERDRRDYLTIVARSSGGHEYDERTAAELAERLERIRRMVDEPSQALDLIRAFRDKPAERFDRLRAVADRLDCRGDLDTRLERGAELLAAELPPSAVARVPEDELTQANQAVREWNADFEGDVTERERAYLLVLNDYREMMGLHRLQLSEELMKAARRHTKDMAGRKVLGHGGSDGSSPTKRARDAGFPPKTLISENVQRTAGADDDVVSVLRNWQESCGHHANMLRPDLRFTGVACEDVWWTQIFGTAPPTR